MELGCSYMNNLNYLFITWFPPKPDFLPPPLQPSSPQLVLVQGMWKQVADVSWKMETFPWWLLMPARNLQGQELLMQAFP